MLRALVVGLALLVVFMLPASTNAATSQRVLILLVTFSDTQPTSLTPTQAAADFNAGVAPYYDQQSYGAVSVSAEAHGWYQIPYSVNGPCSYPQWGSAAKAAAQADGVDVASFGFFMYAISGGVVAAGCNGIDFATPWTGEAWGGPALVTDYCTGRHEFGHLEELNHTDGLGPVGGNCNDRLPAAQLDQRGWLNAQATTGGSYQLVSAEQPSGLRALQVARGDGSRLVLEYRSAIPGLFVERDSGVDAGGFGSYVYYVAADPCAGYNLQAGHFYYDSAVRILVSYAGSGALTVATNADPPVVLPDTTPPSAPLNLTASKSGQSEILAWGASTDDRCGTLTYRLYRNGALLATTADTRYSDSPPRRSTLTYYATAVDAAGNVSGPSNYVVVQTK